MASPLKFILDLDAKMGTTVAASKVLKGIEATLLRLDPGLKRTGQVFNALGAGIGTSLRGAGAGLGLLRDGVNGVGKHVGKFGRDALAQFTALATFAGFSHLISGITSIGKSLIETVAKTERTDAVLTALVGADKAKKLDELANQISAGTEFDDDNLKTFAAGLLRVGFAFDKLPKAFALGADIAALTDADPAQTLAEVGGALERIQQKGGLNFKILSNLGIQKKDFFGDLGKTMGISMEDAEARAEKGKVKLDVIFAQIQKSVGKVSKVAPGAAGQKAGGGLSATLARLQRVPEDIFKSFKGTQASTDMAVAFERLAKLLGPDGPVGSKIVAGIGTAFGAVAKWLATVDFDRVMTQVSAFGVTASEVLGVFGTAFKFIAGVFDWVGTTIGEFVGEIFLEVEKLIGVGNSIGEFFGGIVVLLEDWSSKLFETAKYIGIKIWEGIKSGIASGAASLGGAMSGLLESLMGTTESVLEIHSPSRVFERYGLLTGEGFAKGLTGSMDRIDASLGGTLLPAPSADVGIGMGLSRGGDTAGRPITFTIPITINYSGSGGDGAAEEIAAAVRDILPGQLQHAFERLQVELGTV